MPIVVKAPDNKLRIKTKPIKKITPELVKIAREMIKTAKSFKDPEGVGLASTQIGRNERFFVGKIGKGGEFVTVFNPKIIKTAPKQKVFFEGCLSIPDVYGETTRPISVTVQFQDETGQKITKRLQGIAAWIFQHEVDHLNGTLFMDHVVSQKGRVFKVAGRDQTGSEIFEEVRLV